LDDGEVDLDLIEPAGVSATFWTSPGLLVLRPGAARVTQSVKGYRPWAEPKKSQPPALPLIQVSSLTGGQALSRDRAWAGNLPCSAPFRRAASPKMGNSESLQGKDRPVRSGGLSQAARLPASRLWPQEVPTLRGAGKCNEDEL